MCYDQRISQSLPYALAMAILVTKQTRSETKDWSPGEQGGGFAGSSWHREPAGPLACPLCVCLCGTAAVLLAWGRACVWCGCPWCQIRVVCSRVRGTRQSKNRYGVSGACSFVQGPSVSHEGPKRAGFSWERPMNKSANAQISTFLTQSFHNLVASSTPICHRPTFAAFADKLPPMPGHTQAAFTSRASGLAGLGRVAADSGSNCPRQDSK